MQNQRLTMIMLCTDPPPSPTKNTPSIKLILSFQNLTKQSCLEQCLSSVDDSSRVGNITSSTGISSSDSRDGSRGSSQGGERGRGGNVGVAGSNWGDSSDGSNGGNGRGSVAKTGIAVAQTSVSQTSVAKTIGTVESISLSLSLPLGDMDDSSRVGNVTSSTSIRSSDSRDGSRGKAGNVHGSRGGDASVASSNRSHSSDGSNSSSNRGHSSNSRGSVAKTSVSESSVSQTGVAKTIGTVEGISLSLPLGNMDDSSRVGNVTSSTGISSSDSRDSSRGKASNVHGSRGGDASVAGSIGGSVTSVAKSSIAGITSIAEAGIASTVAKEVGVSLGGGSRSKEESCLESKFDCSEEEISLYAKNFVSAIILTRNLFMLDCEEFQRNTTH